MPCIGRVLSTTCKGDAAAPHARDESWAGGAAMMSAPPKRKREEKSEVDDGSAHKKKRQERENDSSPRDDGSGSPKKESSPKKASGDFVDPWAPCESIVIRCPNMTGSMLNNYLRSIYTKRDVHKGFLPFFSDSGRRMLWRHDLNKKRDQLDTRTK